MSRGLFVMFSFETIIYSQEVSKNSTESCISPSFPAMVTSYKAAAQF